MALPGIDASKSDREIQKGAREVSDIVCLLGLKPDLLILQIPTSGAGAGPYIPT